MLSKSKRVWMTVLAAWLLPFVAWAQLGGLDKTAGEAGYTPTNSAGDTIPTIIGAVISSILAMVGLVFMGLVILGGFHILNSGGSEEGYKKGRDEIKNGIIGLAVVFSAYAITYFVIYNIIGKGGMFI